MYLRSWVKVLMDVQRFIRGEEDTAVPHPAAGDQEDGVV
jgi:hypothetical protein